MRSSPGRLVFMSLLATALGLAGGAAAWVLVRLIALLTNAALLHEYGWDLPSFRHFHPGPELILVAMAGGLLVALMTLAIVVAIATLGNQALTQLFQKIASSLS